MDAMKSQGVNKVSNRSRHKDGTQFEPLHYAVQHSHPAAPTVLNQLGHYKDVYQATNSVPSISLLQGAMNNMKLQVPSKEIKSLFGENYNKDYGYSQQQQADAKTFDESSSRPALQQNQNFMNTGNKPIIRIVCLDISCSHM